MDSNEEIIYKMLASLVTFPLMFFLTFNFLADPYGVHIDFTFINYIAVVLFLKSLQG